MTLKEHFQAKLAAIEAAAAQEKAKVEAEIASVGPLIEHDIEALKTWIANAAKAIGL